jgi:hypothetical protein
MSFCPAELQYEQASFLIWFAALVDSKGMDHHDSV